MDVCAYTSFLCARISQLSDKCSDVEIFVFEIKT